MNDQEKNSAFHGAEADEFWDISKLIPKKKSKVQIPYTSYRPSHVRTSDTLFSPAKEAEGQAGTQSSFDDELRLTKASFPDSFDSSSNEKETPSASSPLEESYVPDFNSLITNVKILHKPTAVSFYKRFREDAVRYFNAEAPKEAAYTPFYSYVPQYSQLNSRQMAYYFFWREAFRRGEYLECDEAYFRLFIYEILNLPDLISAEEGLSLLCRAFSAYRKALPRIEKYMTQWLIDYCLYYRLPCPASALASCMDAIMKNTVFPEFFLYDVENLPDRCVEMLLTLVSDYRRRPQKDNEEHEQFLTWHMAGAMRAVFFKLFSEHNAVDLGRTSHIGFDVFGGSVSAHNIRVRLEVDYHPFSLASELGETVRNAAKYAENLLRAHLGIRTRVRAEMPSASIAEVIDRYMLLHCPKKSAPATPRSEYEHLYEPTEIGISWDSIQGIESASWDVTRRLTGENSADDEDTENAAALSVCEEEHTQSLQEENVNNSFEIQKDEEGKEDSAQEMPLSKGALAYLVCTLASDRAGALQALQLHGISESAAVEEINEAFLLRCGDVFFEIEGDLYRPLIEDYETEVTEWIREMQR